MNLAFPVSTSSSTVDSPIASKRPGILKTPCCCWEGEDVNGVHTLLSGVVQVCHELLVGEEEEKVKKQGRQEDKEVERRSR